ncbi:MAG: hypothetical protein KIH62_002045 [Candidatus Kerfeldbacteria bacterium]|nr:hypothetical protein [Candidatus Kerfeldbacteria bacterium]
MIIDKALHQLGFSKNETLVYLSALELGATSAQRVAKIAGLPRTTVYSVLDQLIKRGVVGTTVVKGKTRYCAEPPHKLLLIVDDIRSKVNDSLPQLEALYNTTQTKPKVLFYEGKGAIRKMFDDTLETKPKEILMWNTNAYFEFERFGHDTHYIDKRVKLGIRARRICGEGSQWHTHNKPRDRQELSKTAVVPKALFWPGIEVNIYANKVVFMNFAENNGIIIESAAIADAMRQAYELSWLGAQTFQDKKS